MPTTENSPPRKWRENNPRRIPSRASDGRSNPHHKHAQFVLNSVKKQLAIDTNEHLKDPEKRRKALLESVIGSSEIEGIRLTKEQWKKIEEDAAKRPPKAS